MVWTSDNLEGRPGHNSQASGNAGKGKSGAAGATGVSGKSSEKGNADNSSKSTACAVAASKAAAGKTGSGSGSSSTSSSSSGSGYGSSSKPKYDPHSRTSPNPISGNKKSSKQEKVPAKPGVFLLIGGVILPIVAVVFELTTHMCAKSFFDPLPTPAHVLLFALIPLSNFLVWMAARRNMTDMIGMLTLGTGMAMGVAILYSLMFLPLVPLSVVAILFFGFGLLALSPLLAIPAVWKSGKYAIHLSKHHKTYFDGHQLEHIGHMIILCTVVAVELPSTLTRMHIGEAAHSKEPVKAIEWLRSFGNQEVMLRACYERSGRATDILGSLYEVKNPTNVSEAREVFYRVTGKPFNSVPLPASLRATRQNQGLLNDGESEEANVEDEFDRDPDIAGETVSGVARGLTMNESKLGGFINGDTCIADLMWNVTFGNTSKYDREVRSKILLPPGAVITNAFLIVNGTEREATVMGRSMARSRYRAAVADKKDPLLVSTCGADRVLLQLFPVAPESKIGVRLNIIAPLSVAAMNKVDLVLPTFEERNFQVDIPTSIALNSSRILETTVKGLKATTTGSRNTIDGSLTTPELARFGAVVSAQRDASITEVVGSEYSTWVGETIKKKTYPKPKLLSVVIDGSNGMAPHFASVLKELGQLPGDISVRLVYVRDGILTDGINVTSGGTSARPDMLSKLKQIEKIPCAGGQINLPFVSSELESAVNNPDSAVLWLHAAQPIGGKLNRTLDVNFRKAKRPLLYDFAVAAGPNEVLSSMYACPALVRVERGGDVQSDLHRLFDNWQHSTGSTATGGIEYFRKPAAKADIAKADPALARLVAFDEISKLASVHRSHKCSYARKGAAISNRYHLVTAFSSAIITEPIYKTRPKLTKFDGTEFRLRNPHNSLSMLGSDSERPQLFNFKSLAPMMMESRHQNLSAKKVFREESESSYSGTASNSGTQAYAPRRQYPVLQGATNGAIGPDGNPFASGGSMQGDQFSSSGSVTQAEVPFVNNAPVQAAAPESPPSPMAQKGGFRMAFGGGGSGKDLSALEEGGAKSLGFADNDSLKETARERKQNALKNARDGADEFNDDVVDGEMGDAQPMDRLADKSGEVASPVVPESDTYLLFGVGMLVLGFALRSNRKVRVKKA